MFVFYASGGILNANDTRIMRTARPANGVGDKSYRQRSICLLHRVYFSINGMQQRDDNPTWVQ